MYVYVHMHYSYNSTAANHSHLQYKKKRNVLEGSLVNGTTCIIAKESVVQETEMEAMVISVTKEVKLTVATASLNDVVRIFKYR